MHVVFGVLSQYTHLRLLQSRRQINYGSICYSSALVSRGTSIVKVNMWIGEDVFFLLSHLAEEGKKGTPGMPMLPLLRQVLREEAGMELLK